MISFLFGMSVTLNILLILFMVIYSKYSKAKDTTMKKFEDISKNIVDDEAFNYMFGKRGKLWY